MNLMENRAGVIYDVINLGDLSVGYIELEGNDDDIAFTFHNDSYNFVLDGSAKMHKMHSVETHENNLAQVAFYGFHSEMLDSLVTSLLENEDPVEQLSILIMRYALSVANIVDAELLLNGIRYDKKVATLDIASKYPASTLQKLAIFEDTINDSPKLVLQYKGDEHFDAAFFEDAMKSYVDELEPLDACLY